MAAKTLTLRQLNRATLARQMLLERRKISATQAIERLAGMQAQEAQPPFIGLWSRLVDFRRESLLRPLVKRQVVRATAMRATLHLMSAKHYLALRPVIQPALTRGMQSVLRKRVDGLDIARLVTVARRFFDAQPSTFAGLRAYLSEKKPEADERAMGYAVRMHLPLVQVPTDDEWGFPRIAEFTPAASWMGEELDLSDEDPRELVRAYLAAFGPATPADAQAWSGLAALREVFEELRPKLKAFRDERGRELFDLPRAPRPSADTPAPVRFIPAFDNLVLAHADRTRIIAEEHRPELCTANLRVLPTFLVDGFAAGLWRLESTKKQRTLVVMPFARLAKTARAELEAEAQALLRFVGPAAATHNVRFRAAVSR